MIGEWLFRHGRGLAFAVAIFCECACWPLAAAEFPAVVEGRRLEFPRDHGAHPAFRTEWWYLTGSLKTETGEVLGMQITFFRYRSGQQENNPSRFAASQLLFAHAAIADPSRGKLLHDQRSARAGFGLAYAKEGDTDVAVDHWTLRRVDDRYRATIKAKRFSMTLSFNPVQPILMQGHEGFSRKGPKPEQASYYYSWPQIQVEGEVTTEGARKKIRGHAWLDHEWSTQILAEEAVGWDWLGLNLSDGGALMVFRMRDGMGRTFWASGKLRNSRGRTEVIPQEAIEFIPTRRWRSARTGVEYPVAMQIKAGDLKLEVIPLLDDQELDATSSTGTIYWEGAVRAMREGKPVGEGYLELTGYGRRVRF